jgi:tetratricopeptide (TPR) repeat protein
LIEAYCNRSVAYAIRGDLQLAMVDLNQAIAIDPNHADAYSRRGTVYAEQGDTQAALADFNKAMEVDPEFSDAYYNRGNFYGTQGNPEAAIADFTVAIRLNPAAADAYGSRGIAFHGAAAAGAEGFGKSCQAVSRAGRSARICHDAELHWASATRALNHLSLL